MTAIDTNLEANYNIAAARGGLDEVMQAWSASSAAFREQADASLGKFESSLPIAGIYF